MAENYRRRGKFEEVAFIFPNAPNIPITVVSALGLAISLPHLSRSSIAMGSVELSVPRCDIPCQQLLGCHHGARIMNVGVWYLVLGSRDLV